MFTEGFHKQKCPFIYIYIRKIFIFIVKNLEENITNWFLSGQLFLTELMNWEITWVTKVNVYLYIFFNYIFYYLIYCFWIFKYARIINYYIILKKRYSPTFNWLQPGLYLNESIFSISLICVLDFILGRCLLAASMGGWGWPVLLDPLWIY